MENLCSVIEKWKLTKYDATFGSTPTGTEINTSFPAVLFWVKVSIDDLNICAGAGTNDTKTGKYTGIGVFTIMEVKTGAGSTLRWAS